MADPSDEFERAKAFFLEGLGEAQLENWALAEAAFRQSLNIMPERESAVSNLLASLVMQEKFQDAWEISGLAIRLGQANPVTNINVGILHHKARNLDQALALFDKAISLDAHNAEAHLNRGKVLLDLNEVSLATHAFDHALQSKPGFKDAEFCKSLALLVAGDFENGWRLYESRWSTNELKQKLKFSQSLWLGKESLKGKTILLHWEQGFGDTIQFSRFSNEVKTLGGNVILKVQTALFELSKSLEGVDVLVADGSPLPPFDYHCPLMSLPLALGTTLKTVPRVTPYLQADQTKVADWSNRLGPQHNMRIGIVWSGNPSHPNDHDRSIPLGQFLAAIPEDCEIIVLQKDIREKDASILETKGNLRHFADALKDFSDTAALCTLVDEVVTVDTSVAHLAGALGVPVNVLLPRKPDFRWLLGRNDSLWYPTMSLHRQESSGLWTKAFKEIKSKLMANQL
ncbi:tetratricopeptide repeat protein [Alphaproteobacteria bacterium LSUCC0719]